MKVEDIVPKLDNLSQMLDANAPGIENHLKEINEDLRQYPDLVFLLSDEQISPIYRAILKHENVVIKVKEAKKRKNNSLLDDGTSVASLL